MNAFWNKTGKMMVCGAAALVVAAGACAQSAPTPPASPTPPSDKAGEGFDKPLKARVKASKNSGTQHFTYMQNDGDHSMKIVVNGDDVSAEVDGKEVPADRIKREGDLITILDEKGEPIGQPIAVGHAGAGLGRDGQALVLEHDGLARIQRLMPGQMAFGAEVNPPPVMLGVTMSEADENVLKHLGIEGGAIQIDTVRDGLPAAKAGLQADDLITSINGQTPATREKLREVLQASKAGDELKVKVMRRGQAQDLTIKLEAYDATKLGNVTATIPRGGVFEMVPGQAWSFNGLDEDMKERLKEARASIEEALTQLKASAKFESEKIRQEVSDSLEKAMQSLAQEQEKLAKTHENLAKRYRLLTTPTPSAPGVPGEAPRALAPESGMVFSVPGSPDMDRRMKALEEQNAALMKKLEELSKKLDDKK